MSTCNCDGTISQDVADIWASFSNFADVFGGVAPDTQAKIACQNAVGIVRAMGIDPCDDDETLQEKFQEELGNVAHTVATEPYQNTIQRATDTAVGGQPTAPIAPKKSPASSSNMTFIIGAIAILALGFFLVME